MGGGGASWASARACGRNDLFFFFFFGLKKSPPPPKVPDTKQTHHSHSLQNCLFSLMQFRTGAGGRQKERMFPKTRKTKPFEATPGCCWAEVVVVGMSARTRETSRRGVWGLELELRGKEGTRHQSTHSFPPSVVRDRRTCFGLLYKLVCVCWCHRTPGLMGRQADREGLMTVKIFTLERTRHGLVA